MSELKFLSDNELFQKYTELVGSNPPPITATTREVIQRKLTEIENKTESEPIINMLSYDHFVENSQPSVVMNVDKSAKTRMNPIVSLSNGKLDNSKASCADPVEVVDLTDFSNKPYQITPVKLVSKKLSNPTLPAQENLSYSAAEASTQSLESSPSPQRCEPSTNKDGCRVRHLPQINKPSHYRSFRRNSISRTDFDPYSDLVLVGQEQKTCKEANIIYNRVNKVYSKNNPYSMVYSQKNVARAIIMLLLIVLVACSLYYLWVFDPMFYNPFD